ISFSQLAGTRGGGAAAKAAKVMNATSNAGVMRTVEPSGERVRFTDERGDVGDCLGVVSQHSRAIHWASAYRCNQMTPDLNNLSDEELDGSLAWPSWTTEPRPMLGTLAARATAKGTMTVRRVGITLSYSVRALGTVCDKSAPPCEPLPWCLGPNNVGDG